MPHGPPHQGTEIPPIPQAPVITPKQQCKIDGGVWDEATQTCIIAPTETTGAPSKPPRVDPNVPEVGEIQGSATQTLTLPDGRTFQGLNREDIALLAQQQAQQGLPLGTAQAGTAQAQANIQARGQQLGQQVGQFGQLGISPTGLDVGEAAVTGIVGAIPRALSLAAGGAAIGAAGGTAVLPGVGTIAGAAIGAAAGFVSGLASAMIGSFKSQRTDTTTAQQRVLDEGKQTLADWATLARNDPVNKAFYLSQFNIQLAQIDQAFRQMKFGVGASGLRKSQRIFYIQLIRK